MTGSGVGNIFGRLMALKQLGHFRRRHRPIKVMPAILRQEFAEPSNFMFSRTSFRRILGDVMKT
jgi:hypothetical protein